MARNPEGWLMVDHRASPGLPTNFYHGLPTQWQGLTPPEGKMAESAVLTCHHCQQPYLRNLWRTRERGHCFKCDGYICDLCMEDSRRPDYVHTPFEKKINDAYELRVRDEQQKWSAWVATQSGVHGEAQGMFRTGVTGNTHLPLRTEKDASDG